MFPSYCTQEAHRLMNVNYFGAYAVAQAFLPVLKNTAKRNFGERPSLIFVNSFAGKVPLKHMAAYSASKHALDGFTQALRSEVEQDGVHVGQVYPGEATCRAQCSLTIKQIDGAVQGGLRAECQQNATRHSPLAQSDNKQMGVALLRSRAYCI